VSGRLELVYGDGELSCRLRVDVDGGEVVRVAAAVKRHGACTVAVAERRGGGGEARVLVSSPRGEVREVTVPGHTVLSWSGLLATVASSRSPAEAVASVVRHLSAEAGEVV